MGERWFEGHAGESVDQLLALEGECRIDSLVLAFEQALQPKAERVGLAGLTDEERTVLAVEALEREVNNGGYGQFFSNDSGVYAPHIVDALRRIGCPKTAEVTARAVKVEEGAPDASTRLEACDQAYLETKEAIADRLFAFIKASRSRITL